MVLLGTIMVLPTIMVVPLWYYQKVCVNDLGRTTLYLNYFIRKKNIQVYPPRIDWGFFGQNRLFFSHLQSYYYIIYNLYNITRSVKLILRQI